MQRNWRNLQSRRHGFRVYNPGGLNIECFIDGPNELLNYHVRKYPEVLGDKRKIKLIFHKTCNSFKGFHTFDR